MTELASNSVYLPPPASARREINYGASGTGSRSTTRRFRHAQTHAHAHSPFTSPILEDDDGPPTTEAVVFNTGTAGMTSSILDTARQPGTFRLRRMPSGGSGLASSHQGQGQQQHRPQQADHYRPSPAIEEEKGSERARDDAAAGAEEEDDVDPYILRPDESRQGIAATPSSDITGI